MEYQETTNTIVFGLGGAPALEQIGGAPPLSINMLRDGDRTNYLRLFPGTSAWSDFPTTIPAASEITGITDYAGKIYYMSADRYLRVVDAPGTVTALSTATATTQLAGTARPVFAKTNTRLWIAGGRELSYWVKGDATMSQLASSNVNRTTHIIANDTRLLAPDLDNPDEVLYTDRNILGSEATHLTGWAALNAIRAEARPDDLVAIHENSSEVFLFGKETLQVVAPDPTVAYAAVNSVNVGCGAPYSIISVFDEGSFAWLTNDREIALADGRSVTYLSRPDMTSTLRAVSTVSDCVGYRVKIRNWDILLWLFPTAGKAYAYERQTKTWFQPSGYDTAAGTFAKLPMTAYHYWAEKDVHLVGLATGDIVKLDTAAAQFAGQPVIGESISGFENAGIEASPKQTLQVTVPMQRGLGTYGQAIPPYVELYYRDAPGAWSQPYHLSLGASEDQAPQFRKRMIGRPYKRRQWRMLVGSGTTAVSIGPMQEVAEILEA